MVSLFSYLERLLENKNFENFCELENSKDSFPALIWWKDLNGKYLGNNKLHALTHGLRDANEPIGLCDADLWPATAPIYIQNDRRAISSRNPILVIEKEPLRSNMIACLS